MENQPDAKLLRIFIGEADKCGHQPLYEKIVLEARKAGLSGATVLKGIMGFGANARISTTKLFEISDDLPLVIEIVDSEPKVRDFTKKVTELLEQSGSGGMITLEKAEVILYKSSET